MRREEEFSWWRRFWLSIDYKIRWGEECVCVKNKNDESAFESNTSYGPTYSIIRD
jgi:hypothetical protein